VGCERAHWTGGSAVVCLFVDINLLKPTGYVMHQQV
jgi:hypothetical protein